MPKKQTKRSLVVNGRQEGVLLPYFNNYVANVINSIKLRQEAVASAQQAYNALRDRQTREFLNNVNAQQNKSRTNIQKQAKASHTVQTDKTFVPAVGRRQNPELDAIPVKEDNTGPLGYAAAIAPFAVASAPFAAAIPTAFANPYVQAGINSYFAAEGVDDIINGRANWSTPINFLPFYGGATKTLANAIENTTNKLYQLSPIFIKRANSFTRGIGGEEGLEDLIKSGLIRGNPAGTEVSAKTFRKMYTYGRNNFKDILNAIPGINDIEKKALAGRYFRRALTKEDFERIKKASEPFVEKYNSSREAIKSPNRINLILNDVLSSPDPLDSYSSYADYLATIDKDKSTMKNVLTFDKSKQPAAYFYDDGRNPIKKGHDYATSKYGVRINNASEYRPEIFRGHLHYSMPKAVSLADPNVEVFKRGPFGLTIKMNKNKLLSKHNSIKNWENFVNNGNVRTRVGDVEIDNPQLYYRQVDSQAGADFLNTGIVRAGDNAFYPNPIFNEGKLFYPKQVDDFRKYKFEMDDGTTKSSSGRIFLIKKVKDRTPKVDLLVSNAEMQPAGKSTKPTSFMTPIIDENGNKLGVVTTDETRRIPLNEGSANKSNTSLYRWEPGYGYREVKTNKPTTYTIGKDLVNEDGTLKHSVQDLVTDLRKKYPYLLNPEDLTNKGIKGKTDLIEHIEDVVKSAQEYPIPIGTNRKDFVTAALYHDLGKLSGSYEHGTNSNVLVDFMGWNTNPNIQTAVARHMEPQEYFANAPSLTKGLHAADVGRGMNYEDLISKYNYLGYNHSLGGQLRRRSLKNVKHMF